MSLTITGILVAGISWLLQHAGVQLGDEQITTFIFTGGQVLGALWVYWGRYRHGDITWYGTTK